MRSRSSHVDRFGWMRRSTLHEAACLSFVRATALPPVAIACGGVGEHERSLDLDEFCEEAYAHHEQYSLVALRRLGDWVLVVEDDSGQGRRPEVLRRVSAGTEVVSVFWDARGAARFSHARSGVVRTAFDPARPEHREGADPDGLEHVRAELPWQRAEAGEAVELMLALAARITGLELAEEHLVGEFATFPVAAWPDDLPRDVEPCGHPPELVEALSAVDGRRCRRAALAVARRALEAADCLEHPVIRATLGALADGRVDQGAISEAVRQWKWQITAHRATSRVRRQVGAAEVLRQATNDNPVVAVMAALSAGWGLRGVKPADLVQAASRALAKP